MGRTKHDWPKICNSFVTSDRTWTLEELAANHAVSISTLRKRAAKEDWTGQRNKYRTDLERKRREKTIRERSQQLSNIDKHNIDLVEALLREQMLYLAEPKKLENEVTPPKPPKPKLKPYEITYFVQNAAVIQDICEKYRGDIFAAISILSDRGILTDSQCHQIAQVLGESEENASEAIAKILRGQGD